MPHAGVPCNALSGTETFLFAKGNSVQCEETIESPKHGSPMMVVICLDGSCLLPVSFFLRTMYEFPVGPDVRAVNVP